jgi:hypothetical protein
MSAGFLADHSGLSRAEKRAELMRLQGGLCAIYGSTGNRLQVDHDHETGLMRGLLCQSCNTREGHAVGDARFAAYRAAPPAAGLQWFWTWPDWWHSGHVSGLQAHGGTVADYCVEQAAFRAGEAARRQQNVIDMMRSREW